MNPKGADLFTKDRDRRDPASIIRVNTATGTWRLDPTASRVGVVAKTFWGLVTVRGRFHAIAGEATVPADGPISAELAIDAASIDTANDKRDRHLRSADFFHAGRHPYLHVAIDQVVLTSTETFTATGHMTVAGRTQPVSIEGSISVSSDGCRAEVDASAAIDRVAFGLDHSPLGMIRRTVHWQAHLVFHAADPGASEST
jgi:polyisoprenoid-binding protein YceI